MFIQWPFDKHLGCFQFGEVKNKAATNLPVHILLSFLFHWSICLSPVLHSFDYCSFVVSFHVWFCQSFNFVFTNSVFTYLIDIWVVYGEGRGNLLQYFWLLWIMFQWTWVYKYYFRSSSLFFFVPPFNCFGFLLRSGSAGSHGNKLFLYFLKLFFYFYSDLSACKMADYSWWFWFAFPWWLMTVCLLAIYISFLENYLFRSSVS